MSKVILVLEKPNSCSECPLFCGHYSDMCCGGLNNRTIDYPYPKDFVQAWCPLRELPNYKDNDINNNRHETGYVWGYNACLGEILGE